MKVKVAAAIVVGLAVAPIAWSQYQPTAAEGAESAPVDPIAQVMRWFASNAVGSLAMLAYARNIIKSDMDGRLQRHVEEWHNYGPQKR